MVKITYKVNKTGRITCYRGKAVLHRIWEEIPIPAGPSRAALLSQLDPVLVQATRRLFGAVFKPASYNEVHRKQALVRQVMADNSRVLIPIYNFVVSANLKAQPYRSVVSRFKGMLQQKDLQDFKRAPGGGCYLGLDSKGRKRKDSDVNRLWGSISTLNDYEPLSEAGWRYIQRLSASTQRQLSAATWQWARGYLDIFNLCGRHGLPALSGREFQILITNLPKCQGSDSKHYFARALTTRFSRKDDLVAEQEIDVIRDWFYALPRVVRAGTRWETLVDRATHFAAMLGRLKSDDMAAYTWTPPIEPFVGTAGVMVVPLSSGDQLLQEGTEMENCLRSHSGYAKRAVMGESQVFSIRGVPGRASVEFVREDLSSPWRLEQAEGPNGVEVTHPVIKSVIEQIQNRMQGDA